MSSSGSSWRVETQGSSLAFVKPMPARDSVAAMSRDSSLELAPTSLRTASAVELWSQLHPVATRDMGQPIAIPACQLGHFRVEEQIGRGGMGAVFRAVDTRLDRLVALKVLSPTQSHDPNSIERFRNEARAAAQMDHENIARVYFVGEDQGLPFIAFEFVHGVNVRELIERRGPLDPTDAVNYTLQIATALRHTDAAGVVHRDIKPSNIIITPQGRAKLVDLGLARKRDPQASDDLTLDGTTLGTFDYISPEQAKDPRNVDVRSDIYSLGCTLYHMLTGAPPYPVGTMLQKLLDHQAKDIPDAAEKNPQVPPDLASVVRTMMASDPRDRYSTPDELIAALSTIAHRFGLEPTPTDAVVWTPPRPAEGWGLWKQYGGWMLTAALLLVSVLIIDLAQPPRVEDSAPEPPRLPSALAAGSRAASRSSDHPSLTAPTEVTDGPQAGLMQTDPAARPLPPAEPSLFSPAAPLSLGPFPPAANDAVPQLLTDKLNPADPLSGNGGINPESSLPQEAADSTPSTGASGRNTTGTEREPDPPPAAVLNPNSFVLLVNNLPPQAFRTLEAACAAAPNQNAVIELQFNGDQHPPQAPLRLVGKSLRIRAAKDYRPTLRFALPERYFATRREESVPVISLSGGSLDLNNIDLKLTVDPLRIFGHWVLFSLVDVEHLELHGVSITLENEAPRPAALIEHAESGRTTFADIAPDPVKIVAEDCFFRGEGDFLLSRTIDPARIRLNNVALALGGAIVRLEGTDTYDVMTDMKKGHDVELELKHVTALLRDGLATFDVQVNHSVPRLVVQVGDSVVSTTAPLIVMQGDLEPEDFRDRLTWSEYATFLEGPDTVWQISSPSTRAEINRSEFDELWSSSVRRPPGGGWGTLLRPQSDRRHAEMTRDDLQLDASQTNPAVDAASDGSDAGVDWDAVRLPRLDAVAAPSNGRSE
ncbi:MAG: protein kinase [Planctomycetaceae bacterium]|nr:protein kinase [Planctomycetaceae bacterium]